MMTLVAIVFALLTASLPIETLPREVGAEAGLNGIVLDAETNGPVANVTITLDGGVRRFSAEDGTFDFGPVADGSHALTFAHFSYKPLSKTIEWPAEKIPLVVVLKPSPLAVKAIVVKGERVVRSLPVSSISVSREDATMTAGNIANDPLRTVQSQPSCAADANEFFPKLSVRGGDTEESQVYFDGYPLKQYAHVGGFAGVVYDDMLESTVLVPGAPPIRYTGTLSGVVLLTPAKSDTTFRSFRYDITSMAGGIGQVVAPSLSFQVAAKTNFFNLPVYQQPGVNERSFKDVLGRVIWSPRKSVTMTTTLLAAADTEILDAPGGVEPTRDVNSVLAGVHLSHRRSGWELSLRPSFSTYDSRDVLTWEQVDINNNLRESRWDAELTRPGKVFGVGFVGDVGTVRHSGTSGTWTGHYFSASVETKALFRNVTAFVFGVGGSREPWTEGFQPEAYGSVRLDLGNRVSASTGYRRSHQSPFVFTERRYFASLPIDADDLLANYEPSWEKAPAVQMDQISAEATVHLPLRCSLSVNGFRRSYENLLTWQWDDFPGVTNVTSNGSGRGHGYEIVFMRDDPDLLSVMAAVAQARVWKKEGTLEEERIGDFDRPDSWQVGVSARLSDELRLSVRWMDVSGRPYTSYVVPSAPPTTEKVNAVRLPRFQRLDAKVVFTFHGHGYTGEAFVDVVNCLNHVNIVERYAVEIQPDEFVSAPYWGTLFFPIGGVTIRW